MIHALVLGSGISGLNFSLRLAAAGHRVTIVTKKNLSDTSTNLAQGGIAAVLQKTDDFQKHAKDTLTAGSYHNKKSAVEFMVRHGPRAIERLIELGVPFATRSGSLLLTREGGHGERRIAFVGDYTGQAIEKVLVKKVRKHRSIKILEHAFAADLLVKNGRCYGATVQQSGKLKNMFADMTILATGGLGQAFGHTTNPSIATGDGYAMAARIGIPLKDLEFIQFHPTAFSGRSKRLFLLSEALRGEGAYLRNEQGKRLMIGQHPLKELAPRDVVARAVFKEMKTGKVFLDMRHKNSHEVRTRFPTIYETLKRNGYDLCRDLIPITTAAHYCCGGVVTDFHGQTKMKNLFAFGEVAWTGVHGANRLASNSLLEAVVFSDQILRHLPDRLPKRPGFPLPVLRNNKKFGMPRRRIHDILWDNVSIVRTKKGLQNAVKELKKILANLEAESGFSRELWETKNMALTGLMVAKAALKRVKSLGCHYRAN